MTLERQEANLITRDGDTTAIPSELDREEFLVGGGSSPLWRRIEARLKRMILNGDYAPGARLPPDRQIASDFGANRLTARRALASLQQQGLLRIEQGNGTFVADQLVHYSIGERVRFNENLDVRNATPRRVLLRDDEVEAAPQVALRLGIEPGEPVLKLDILGYANERPISVFARYAPAQRFRGLSEAFKGEGSFSGALRHFGVHDFRRKVTEVFARLPTPLEARLLEQPKTQAVLAVESVDVDLEGTPISFQAGCFAGGRVAVAIDGKQSNTATLPLAH